MQEEKDHIGLYSTDKPKVTVKELISQLQTLPQDLEIVIYPKYDGVRNMSTLFKHRFHLCDVKQMSAYIWNEDYENIPNITKKGIIGTHKYCAIVF